MISNLLIVFGIIAFVLLFAVALFLFTPFYFCADFSWLKSCKEGYFSFWYLNPSFFVLKYNIKSKKLAIKLLRFKIRKKRKADKEQEFSEKAYDKTEPVPRGPDEVIVSETEPQRTAVEPKKESKKFETGESEEIQRVEDTVGTEDKQKIAGEIDKKKDKKKKKSPNLITRLKQNKVLFFLRAKKLRSKILNWIFRIFKTILKVVSFRRFGLKGKAGIEDPAILGEIYGYVEALKYGLGSGKNFRLEFTPVFMQNYLECSGSVSLRSSLWRLLLPLFVAVFTFPYLSILVVWLRYKYFIRKCRKKNEKNDG